MNSDENNANGNTGSVVTREIHVLFPIKLEIHAVKKFTLKPRPAFTDLFLRGFSPRYERHCCLEMVCGGIDGEMRSNVAA